MESKWLEDYLTLVEEGSFTKAAERRYVTQPAFSRRIRSLEQWLGVELIDRNSFPVRLTSIGEESLHHFQKLLDDVNALKKTMQALDTKSGALIISTQASLSVSFCPAWLTSLTDKLAASKVRIVAGDFYDSIEQFLSGHCDLLLCYAHEEVIPKLQRSDLRHIKLSDDKLVPVSSPSVLPEVQHRMRTTKPLDMVSFTAESFFGQLILDNCISMCSNQELSFTSVLETSLSESVHAHVLAGKGVAWLPKSLVQEDLLNHKLSIIPNLPTLDLQIILFSYAQEQCTQLVNNIWQYTAQ